jgi:methyl-accepting chemotaxis protein
MRLLKNMKIGMKILLLITVAFMALIVVGLVNLQTINKMSQNATSMYQDALLPVKYMNSIRSNVHEQEALLLQLISTSDASTKQALQQRMNDIVPKTQKLLDDYSKTRLSPFEAENLKKFNDMRTNVQDLRKKVTALADQNKFDEARNFYATNITPVDQTRDKILLDLANYNEEEASNLNDQITKYSLQAQKLSILILIGSLLVFSTMGYLITRLVTKPIRVMQNLMEKAETGDLTVRGAYVSKDEVGSLTKSFNVMLEGLGNLMKRINESSLSLSAMSEQLSASAEQAGQAATQITEAIQEVSTGSDKQLDNVQSTGKTIERMSLGIRQISDHSEQVSEKANLASESAIDGKKAIEQSVSQMNNIQSSVGHASRSITELGEQAQHIGNIVAAIQGIANQTNLLALNAAIEAARVGEQGKGFTVVATEIRKLAEQSSQSAKQIAEYIQSVQAKINTAVFDMEVGAREVADGTAVMNHVSQSFDQIHRTVNEVTYQIRNISDLSKQIVSGTHEVVKSFGVVSEVASSSAAETQTVSAATEEQLASMEEIAASANALSKTAEELQGDISFFKV